MISYEVLLGVDKAARDTGRRMRLVVKESGPLEAALKAERLADRKLAYPDIEYTHAMSVQPVIQPIPVATAMPLAVAA